MSNGLFSGNQVLSGGMMADAPGRERGGFTLVEILVALIVLMVGLLGILSLFPYSMDNIRQTAEYTEASTIASSFHQSLLTGVHNAGTRKNVVTIHHSGVYNSGDGINEKYTFPLPENPLKGREEPLPEEGGPFINPTSFWIPCPGGNPLCPELTGEEGANIAMGGGGTGEGESGAFLWNIGHRRGGGTGGANATDLRDLIQNIRENFDPSIGTDQYSVAMVVRNRAYYPGRLYEVLIRVYRSFSRDPNVNIPRTTGGTEHKDLIREYRAKVAR